MSWEMIFVWGKDDVTQAKTPFQASLAAEALVEAIEEWLKSTAHSS
jgi:hypothetical protein